MIDMRPGEVQRWRVRRAYYRAGAGAAPTGASYLQGSSVALADMTELRRELSIHRDRLDQSPLPHAFCDRGDPSSAVVQFRASVFHFPASALYGVDGGEQIGAATGRVLCGGFLPGECDLRMFDLGTHSRSRGFADRARYHALSIGHHLMPFWNCRHCSAEISTGWTRYLHLLPDRLSETRSARIGEVKISRKTQAPPRPFGRFVDLSAVRRDPPPLWLCRFCASALAKSSGCQPLGN